MYHHVNHTICTGTCKNTTYYFILFMYDMCRINYMYIYMYIDTYGINGHITCLHYMDHHINAVYIYIYICIGIHQICANIYTCGQRVWLSLQWSGGICRTFVVSRWAINLFSTGAHMYKLAFIYEKQMPD